MKGGKKTEVSLVFEQHMRELGIDFGREHRFHHERKWRADWVLWEGPLVLVECEGGAWTHGRHTRGKGFIGDMEKYNVAAKLGYHVLRFTPQQVLSGEAKQFIKEFFGL